MDVTLVEQDLSGARELLSAVNRAECVPYGLDALAADLHVAREHGEHVLYIFKRVIYDDYGFSASVAARDMHRALKTIRSALIHRLHTF